jgi:hypothetical protein
VNLTGFFWLTQRVIAEMVTRHGGDMVNITTTLVDNASASSPSVLTALTQGATPGAVPVASETATADRGEINDLQRSCSSGV